MSRNNNGGEFCFVEFVRIYKENDIERNKTTPYNLEKIGVVKCIQTRC